MPATARIVVRIATDCARACGVTANSLQRTATLLVAEGFDGVEVGGLPCGIDAEDESDGAGDAEAGEHPHGGQGGGQTNGQHVDDPGKRGAQEYADYSAYGTQCYGLGGELGQDGFPGGAQSFANADLTSALGDRDEHDVHYAHSAHHEADAGDGDHQPKQSAGNLLPELINRVRAEDIEVIVGGDFELAADAHHLANLLLDQ